MPGRLSPPPLPSDLRVARTRWLPTLFLLAGATGAGCNTALAHGLATALESRPPATSWRYEPAADSDLEAEERALLERFAPRFVVEGGEANWNRIGTPTLRRRAWVETARVDTARATLYARADVERVGTRSLLQLVYRIHFDQLAFRAGTLASMHRNAGLLVLVGVERETRRPLTLTTVHTCGCWLAVQPTMALAPEALPREWPAEFLEVAGESLAARLPEPGEGEGFVVYLRSGSHRVHDVRVGTLGEEGEPVIVPTTLRDMQALRRLPIVGTAGESGSFFYEGGYLRGYVRGAWAPLEGLTLGLLTLDLRLGMDRDFGDPETTGARFFTALAPWKREASRLDRFDRALAQLGFALDAFAPVGGI